MKGLYKLKNKGGKDYTYYVDVTADGRRKRMSTGTGNLQIARKALDRIRGDVAMKKFHLDQYNEQNISLESFREEYIEKYCRIQKSPKTVVIDKSALQKLEKYFGKDKTLRSISRTMIEGYRAHMLLELKLSPTSVNINIRSLRAAWNWAKDKNRRFVTENIFDGLKQLPVDEKVRRYMTEEEIAKWFTAVRDPSLDGWPKICALETERLVQFLLMVGSRRTESVSLKWKHVDFTNSVVVFEKTKTDKTRYIPLNSEVIKLLKEIKAARPDDKADDPIFHFKDPESAGKAFRRFAVKAGLPEDITLHSTRHTAATAAIRKGVHLLALKDFLGHAALSTTMAYAKVVPESLKEVSNSLSVEGMIEKGNTKADV